MKTAKIVLAASVAALMSAPGLLAQPPGPPGGFGGPGGPGGPGGMMRMMPVMAALDADGSGDISAEEINNATASLKTLDKNKDGKLTEDELRPNFGGRGEGPGGGGPGGGGQGPEAMMAEMMALDKNGDGKLELSEVGERRQGMFARADADKDGSVTRDELRRMIEAQIQGGRGGFGGPPEGREGGRGGFGGPPEGREGAREGGREGAREGGRGEGPPEGRGPGFGGPGAFIDRMFEFDADKDGKLSREELAKMAEQGGGFGGRGGFGGQPGGGGRPQRPPAE